MLILIAYWRLDGHAVADNGQNRGYVVVRQAKEL